MTDALFDAWHRKIPNKKDYHNPNIVDDSNNTVAIYL